MPPGAGPTGNGKKHAAAAIQKQSRNSTPAPSASLPTQEPYDPDFLNTRVILFQDSLSYDDLVDQHASNAAVPDSKSVDAMLAKLKDLVGVMEKRSNFYDRGMRFLADERKKRPEDYGGADGEQEGKRPKHKRKKASDSLAPPDAGNGGAYYNQPLLCHAAVCLSCVRSRHCRTWV
jgi:transcriptional adapter 3